MTELLERLKTHQWWLAGLCGLLAFMIARESGVPTWRDWEIGDATDIGVVTAAIVIAALKAMEAGEHLKENDGEAS